MADPTPAELQSTHDEVTRMIAESGFVPGDQSYIYLLAFFRVRAHMLYANRPEGKTLKDAYEQVLRVNLPDLAYETCCMALSIDPKRNQH